MKKVICLALILVLCLTGCSSGGLADGPVKVKLEGGKLNINGTVTDVTEYNGYTATIANGKLNMEYKFVLDPAVDVTSLSVNVQGVQEENMDKVGDAFYYLEYLGTVMTVAKKVGKDMWMVCQVYVQGNEPSALAKIVKDYMDTITLTENGVIVEFDGFEFKSDYGDVVVRPDCALVKGQAKVSMVPKDCNTPVVINQDGHDYSLMKTSTAKYEYYSYNGCTIQVVAGMPLTDYIKFK